MGVDDYINIQVYQNTGASLSLYGYSTFNFFTIHRYNDSAVTPSTTGGYWAQVGSNLSYSLGDVSVSGYITATDFIQSSDIRLKTLINDSDFTLMDNIEIKSYYYNKYPDRIRYGAIAQEVEKYYPEMVSIDNNDMLKL